MLKMDSGTSENHQTKDQTVEIKEETGTGAEHTESKPTPDISVQPEPEKKVVKSEKIELRLQAAGDAPIMKQKKYTVDGKKQISWILAFIRKYLKLEPQDNLFVYVNQAFSPSPDQTVNNLAECFGQDNKLVLYYSRSQAWG